ncbi:MAG: hypothetical protein HY683_00825 [Chloroflexi bacterium]|nr:hypothetical protein [Chloroflexota bacterium]
MNAELERHVLQLEAANRELEAFAYSVSHDLRAPLRAIDGFSQAVLEDYKDKLDVTGADYLARVRRATQRMGQLIDDMLKLSRVTRAEMHHQQVDLSVMVNSIADSFRQTTSGRQVTMIVASGLVAEGDPVLLQTVLENLLSNAWKFPSRLATITIEFGLARQSGADAYFVRDNGVGFDMAYADKLFRPCRSRLVVSARR